MLALIYTVRWWRGHILAAKRSAPPFWPRASAWSGECPLCSWLGAAPRWSGRRRGVRRRQARAPRRWRRSRPWRRWHPRTGHHRAQGTLHFGGQDREVHVDIRARLLEKLDFRPPIFPCQFVQLCPLAFLTGPLLGNVGHCRNAVAERQDS